MKKQQIDSGVTSAGFLKPQKTQTRYSGTAQERYNCYLQCADDGNGNDITTGFPLKTFNQWMGGEE